jgi:mevalonate kinase
MIKDSTFYGKILLFGEYGIIQDSMGLSIPHNAYRGFLTFDKSSDSWQKSNEHLGAFANYLEEKLDSGELDVDFHIAPFQKDLQNGLNFDSSIPTGFGVGSSGALVAAVYNKYAVSPLSKETKPSGEDIKELKRIFSIMESYFHGKSSGLDPLICYLNLPVLIRSKNHMDTVGMPENAEQGKGAIFLINSGKPGETEPMVNIFMEKMKHEGFRNMLKKEFKKYNDLCIEAFLNRDVKPLFNNLKKLSSLLFANFKPMIPDGMHQMWQEGLESNDYYLKLCGSGGGGYFLGFAEDFEKAKSKLSGYQLEVVHTF